MTSPIFKAVIFDLDGVITNTAAVHSKAWKQLFDEYLKSREKKFNEQFKEFTHESDYLPYVDGKPRYKGVQDFLLSRGIEIPFGNPDDSNDTESCCGLGNRKNLHFNRILKENGVEVFESTVKLINDLKTEGVRIGVASSSKNCKTVLEAAGILNLFETRVDGVVSAAIGLMGKPEPDIFTVAASNLGAKPHESIVVEDAVSGVQAGRKGNFGLVLGIAREDNEQELKTNGADVVVKDLEEISIQKLDDWFKTGREEDSWNLCYHDFEPGKEKSREALLAVGNGYFGTRGALEECKAGENHYPGTYLAGLYNRLTSTVAGREIENEDFVNIPNWLPFNFRIGDDGWFNTQTWNILSIDRTLSLKTGLLDKTMLVEDPRGRQVKIQSFRFASMDNAHLAAIKWSLTPMNFEENLVIRTGLDGKLINDGVNRYRDLSQQHLEPVDENADRNLLTLRVRTVQSKVEIAEVAKLLVSGNQKYNEKKQLSRGQAFVEYGFNAQKGEEISVEKLVSIFSSKPDDVDDPLQAATALITENDSFEGAFNKSAKAWKSIWDNINISIDGDRKSQKLIRLHLYHMMVSSSVHNMNLDTSFTARGLHGEAYRGHIFWDELFIMPFYNEHFPEVSKAALMYRYNRLDEARKYARENGYKGAMFPWQSGSSGREETQVVHLNPVTGEWGADYSSLQRHVSLAVAKNVIDYFHTTHDNDFMDHYGLEMLLEIARFWASKCEKDETSGRNSISGVMGPDEFHEMYPGAEKGGLTDNAYTNLMVAWLFEELYKIAGSNDETEEWVKIANSLNLDINGEGIIAQYKGYFDLEELDWDLYKKKYGNIYRMDRLLKAEGKSPDTYKVAKQADTLQIFFNLEPDIVSEMLEKMGYQLPSDYLQKNMDYYLARTSHGSTLSRIVHAKLAMMAGNPELSWNLFSDALESDFVDTQGGTTAEGIHFGVMAGTVLIAINTFAGVNFKREKLTVQPHLPEGWNKVSFNLLIRGVALNFEISNEQVIIKTKGNNKLPIKVIVFDNEISTELLRNKYAVVQK